jgi:hypothetical protein
LKDQQALFEQVWKSLDALKSGKTPELDPGEIVKKFTATSSRAGQEPILTFDLGQEIRAGDTFDIKYWAQINDKDAPEDLNGTIPNLEKSKYVNYKHFFIRYDEKDEWEKVEYGYSSKKVASPHEVIRSLC